MLTHYRHQRALLILGLLALLSLLSFFIALIAGNIAIDASELWRILLTQEQSTNAKVIWTLRLPRAIAGFEVGALLALSGALLQVLLRNPLADPYVLGISGGAATSALISMWLGAGSALISGSAAVGAMVSVLLVFGLSHSRGTWSSMRLLLTGVVIASGWTAIISFILAIAPERNLRGMLFWLMGDLSYSGMPTWSLLILCLGLVICMSIARDLNVLARGELPASALGVNLQRLRLIIYFTASILTATVVSSAGSIGFVGLIVPHMLRLLGVSDHRILLPGACLLGGSLLVLADTMARTIVAPQQLPVGIITALLGVPVFLLLLQKNASTH